MISNPMAATALFLCLTLSSGRPIPANTPIHPNPPITSTRTQTISNCTYRIVYRMKDENDNSGIFIRIPIYFGLQNHSDKDIVFFKEISVRHAK